MVQIGQAGQNVLHQSLAFGRRVPAWDAAPCEKAVPMLAARRYALGARIPVRCNVGF